MKILHVQSLHLHVPWLVSVARWAVDVDVVTVAGDCMPVTGYERWHESALLLRSWISGLRVPVMYSRGGYDPSYMADWGLRNLGLGGTHEIAGVAFHVIDTYSLDRVDVSASTLPGVVVSHFPPAGAACAIETPSGECLGRGDVRYKITTLGDVRVALCGRVLKPRARADWVEGALAATPGMSHYEHADDPAFLRIDLDARTVVAFDGVRESTMSFAR